MEQLNVVGFTETLRIPQASLLPLFTEDAVIDPFPLLSNCTVTFWQMAFGAWRSLTVTVKEQLEEPQTFEAVNVTVVTPRLKVEPEPVPDPLPVVAPVNAYETVGDGAPTITGA